MLKTSTAKQTKTKKFDQYAKLSKLSGPSVKLNPSEIPLFGVCTEDGLSQIGLKNPDPFSEALCDFGIKSVRVKPAIEFDNDNGYLHLSSDLILEVYDWLRTATGT